MVRSDRVGVLAILVCLTFAYAPEASAWGPDGHRIVCRIAYQLLDAPRQAKIRDLTSAFRDPDGNDFDFFTNGCIFPDDARTKARNNVPGWDKYDPFEFWHFLNVPRTTRLVEEAHCNSQCVLTGIARHANDLATASTDQDRAEALFFLGHWLGDIHQPLHISYSDDLGGNDVKPINGKFYSSGSLHSVWDSGIITKNVASDGWRIYADRLAAAITPAEQATWIGAPPLTWAQESYLLTTKPKALYCGWQIVSGELRCARLTFDRTLMQPYQDAFGDDVELRLQQAGARLADLLRQKIAVP